MDVVDRLKKHNYKLSINNLELYKNDNNYIY